MRKKVAGRREGAGRPAGTRTPEPEKEIDVSVTWGVRVPMRDGVRLAATLYRSRRSRRPLPVVFTLTPYIADSYHERGSYFARHGYVFALVDVRGRGNSEGVFEPMANEGRDGHDLVEWLARQPFCNGKVAMWGGSYGGFDQWATAKETPPHLATIVPAAAAFPGVDFPFLNNRFYSYETRWLTFTNGRPLNEKAFDDLPIWIGAFREMYLRHRPFRELDRLAGNPSPIFQKWLDHPTPDAYWDSMVPSREMFRRIRLPVLTITGHYDADQPGAMEFYRRHMQYAPRAAAARHYLVIGPWDHPGTRTPKREVGGLTFGEASLVDLNALHREWYDWTMKRGPRPPFLKNRVAWYVPGPGAETWKYAPSLERIPTRKRLLFLDSVGSSANDVFASGRLTQKRPVASDPDEFVYDPQDVRPADLEDQPIKEFCTDQHEALNLFGNGLIYHTEPMKEATEITGYVRLRIWISLDVPDTDFHVALYEIPPNGGSIVLADDYVRARYRHSLRKAEPAKPGHAEPYEFRRFAFFSRRLARYSRLRLLLDCPNSIDWQKNYNTGGDVSAESGKDARVAHVTVYHDRQRPSALEIPFAI